MSETPDWPRIAVVGAGAVGGYFGGMFARAGAPTHAARQLPSGRWSSKLGPMEDIEHELQDVTGSVYGSVVLVLKRPLPA